MTPRERAQAVLMAIHPHVTVYADQPTVERVDAVIQAAVDEALVEAERIARGSATWPRGQAHAIADRIAALRGKP